MAIVCVSMALSILLSPALAQNTEIALMCDSSLCEFDGADYTQSQISAVVDASLADKLIFYGTSPFGSDSNINTDLRMECSDESQRTSKQFLFDVAIDALALKYDTIEFELALLIIALLSLSVCFSHALPDNLRTMTPSHTFSALFLSLFVVSVSAISVGAIDALSDFCETISSQRALLIVCALGLGRIGTHLTTKSLANVIALSLLLSP